jgi:molybdopterin molybdotransferase
MKTVAEALAHVLGAVSPCGVERVAILEALGLFSADAIAARRDLPPFDNSAMDGYAVRAADVAGGSEERAVTLPVRGESRAGGSMPGPLEPGSAMRIFTGAPMPSGADAVVVQEDTEREGERVSIRFASGVGAHVRARASDVASGDSLFAPGDAIGPGEIALLASQGIAAVSVFRRPIVAILSTGDELRDVSDPPEPGTIVNSNAYALAALVRETGGIPRVLPIAPDDPAVIAARVEEALVADVVLSTGGVSVGEHDHVQEAFARAGIAQEFWKVRMKPGKPVAFGTHGRTPVIGLPGNPVSAMVTFEVFVRPALRCMLGDRQPHPPAITVQLAAPYERKPGRLELARAKLESDGDRTIARLHRQQGSGSLPSVVGIDALVILPSERATVPAGALVAAIRLGARGGDTSAFDGVE